MLPLPSLGPPAAAKRTRWHTTLPGKTLFPSYIFNQDGFKSAQDAFKTVQDAFKPLQEPSKSAQDDLKKLQLQFGPVLVSFWFPKGSPETLKIKEFHETSSKFCDFALFSSSRLRDPILDPSGLRFGSPLAFKTRPRVPKRLPRHLQERPRGL